MAKKNKQQQSAKKSDSGSSKDPPSHNNKKKNREKGKKKGKHDKNNHSQWGTEEDVNFRKSLEADGRYAIIEMDADGNCLFRSLSDQLHLDHGNSHAEVRDAVCNYIEKHEEDFSVFLALDDDEEEGEDGADFESYVASMREDGEWGGHLELVAAARLYKRNITVFSSNLSAMNICHGEKKSSGPGLLLSYHDGDHYSSVRDANAKATTTMSSKKEKKPSSESEESNKSGKKSKSKPPVKEESPKPPSQSTSPTKKNALCHCGSGKKYKKCCSKADRRDNKASKGDPLADSPDPAKDDTLEMNGNFRVLQI